MPSVDEIAQPLSRERVYLVVVSGGHGSKKEPRSVAGLGVVKVVYRRAAVAALAGSAAHVFSPSLARAAVIAASTALSSWN